MRLILLAISAAFVSTAAVAAPRPAKCTVSMYDDEAKGPCMFEAVGTKGSFTITGRGRPILVTSMGARYSSISVTVVAKGLARASGVSNRMASVGFGNLVRSELDSACWVSETHTICVY